MTTRTITECQRLADLWVSGADGDKEAVIQELGGEPTSKFIASFSNNELKAIIPKLPKTEKLLSRKLPTAS